MATPASSGFRFPASSSSKAGIASTADNNNNNNNNDTIPSSPSKSHRSSFSNPTSTPSHHAPSTPKHTPNPHPYAIKTTSTALLSRSSSRSSSHYDSYHHYVPTSEALGSPVKSPVKRGYGYGGASESESEDGGSRGLGAGVGTGRHRYSRSLTGGDVPPLPVPPKEGGVVYDEPEGMGGRKGTGETKGGEDEDDDTPRKKPSREGKSHRYSHSHASYLGGKESGGVVSQYTGGDGDEDAEGSTDEPLPSSSNTSSGLDRTWTFNKGSKRVKSVRLNDVNANNDDTDELSSASSKSSRGSHSRSSSVPSNASGRVRDMIDSLERSVSVSSGLDEEGSVSESLTGSESRIESWKRGAGMSPTATRREVATNAHHPTHHPKGSVDRSGTKSVGGGGAQKALPVRGSVNDLFGTRRAGAGAVVLDEDDGDHVATVKKRRDDDATLMNVKKALNGREPRLLPFPPSGSAAHQHRTLTPSHTGVAYPLPPSPQRDHNDPRTSSAPPLDVYEFGVKRKNVHANANMNDGFGQYQHDPLGQHLQHDGQHYQHDLGQHHQHGRGTVQYQHRHQQEHYAYPQSQYSQHAQHAHPQHSQQQQHLHPQHTAQHLHPQHTAQHPQHPIVSPQTQIYVVRHNPSPGVMSPITGGGSPGATSPGGRGSRGSNGSHGKRLLPFPPVVKEGELHHPRPKRIIGGWGGEVGGEGEAKANEIGNVNESKSGVESGVEGYVTALETAEEESSTSTSTSSSVLTDEREENEGGDGDTTIMVHVQSDDVDEPSIQHYHTVNHQNQHQYQALHNPNQPEPTIEELLKQGQDMLSSELRLGYGDGKGVSGVEAWEMELGETVRRIGGMVGKGGSVRAARSVRGPRLSASGLSAGVGGNIGIHGDGTMSVGDLPSVSLGRSVRGIGGVGEIGRKAGTAAVGGATRRGGVLELFDIPVDTSDERRGEKEGEGVVDEKAEEEEKRHVKALEDREHELSDREHELSDRDVALDRKDYSLVERDLSLVERQSELEHRDHSLLEREHDLDARERVLDVFKQALDKRAEGMDKRSTMLDEREGEVMERESEVMDEERERGYVVGVRESEVSERESAVWVREGELDERENKLDERESVGKVWEGEMGERENKLDEREGRLDEREKRLEERETALVAERRELEEKEENLHVREVAVEKREEKVVDNERRIKNRLREVQKKEQHVEEREVEAMKRDEERKSRARASADVNVKELANVGVGLEGRERELERKERLMEERERVIKVKEATLAALEKEVDTAKTTLDDDHPFWPLPISLLRKGWGSLVMPLVGEDKTPEFLLPYQPPRRSVLSNVMNDDEAEQDRPSSPLEGNESVVSAGSTSTVTPNRGLRRRGGGGGDPTSSIYGADGQLSCTKNPTASTSTLIPEDQKKISPWVIKRDFLLCRLGFGYFTNVPGEAGMLGGRLNGGYWVLMSIGVCVVVLKALSLGGVRGVGGVLRGGAGRR